MIFDLVVDFETTFEESEKAVNNIIRKIKEKDSRYNAVIKAENSYAEQQINEIIEKSK